QISDSQAVQPLARQQVEQQSRGASNFPRSAWSIRHTPLEQAIAAGKELCPGLPGGARRNGVPGEFLPDGDGARPQRVVSTTRKRASPESILSYASDACSSGNTSIIGRTPVRLAKRSVSSESMPPTEACPRTNRLAPISSPAATCIGSWG